MKEKPKILYVEDDETLSFLTQDNLELKGYNVTHCENGKLALNQFHRAKYDLCILDVMLPEMDGFELAKRIREVNEAIPIIFLTAKSLKEDKLEGLGLGGDDYMTKPFSIEELHLKIQIFLKRKNIVVIKGKSNYSFGVFSFDYPNLLLKSKEEEKSLTQKEADLLKLLLDHSNEIVKRENILQSVWGENDYFIGRSMDVFISRLRKYLSSDQSIVLENIHGVGFRLKY